MGSGELACCVRRVAVAVANATRREEVFESVREEFTDATDFVWTGTLDVSDWSLEPTVDADPHLADILTSESDVVSIVEEAVTTEQVTTVRPDGDWRDHAVDAGYDAAAIVPLSHRSSVYGLIVVGSDSPTLDANEAVLADLGVIVGHALAALTRREAMLGGEEFVVEFRERDAAEPIVGEDLPPEAEFHFERTIPVADGALLQYVTVSGMAPDEFQAQVEAFEDVTHVRRVGGDEQPLFETVYVGPSIVKRLVGHDAWVVRSYYEDGDHYTVAALPPGADIEAVVDDVTDTFPAIEVVSQRSLRDWRSTRELRTTVRDRLTDRQRATVEAALAAGYFERPRRSNGEEVAAALDVSPSTFSQHLRAAHRKVYDTLFHPDDERI